MATLADLMESARNYTGRLNWQRGKDIERIAGGDPDKAAVLEQLMSLGEGGGHSVGGLAGAIRAYHGTPHTFDRFDLSKIGTGEGAQTYGHGLYFAENPKVARDYQHSLSDSMFVDSKGKDFRESRSSNGRASLLNEMKKNGKQDKEIIDYLKRVSENHNDKYGKSAKNVADKLEKGLIKYKTGNLYELNLRWPDAAREASDPFGEHHLLDWDAPLSEQPEQVRNAIDKFASEYGEIYGLDVASAPWEMGQTTGETIYRLIANGNKPNATKTLRDLGIPGIRYLDQGSRAAGEGTRNYVIFDDQIPEILSRNGEPVRGLSGMMERR